MSALEGVPDATVRDNPRWPFKYEMDPQGGRYQPIPEEVVIWCFEQFGEDQPRWVHSRYHLAFRDESDAIAFKMRWW